MVSPSLKRRRQQPPEEIFVPLGKHNKVQHGQRAFLKNVPAQQPSDLPAPAPRSPALLQSQPSLNRDEEYSNDEQALNSFLKLHPMLSMESTSQKTLQLVVDTFERANVQVDDLPVVSKSHDDSYLRPPNSRIGERECACAEKCICRTMALLRHGHDTDLAFVGTEFLLPSEQVKFLAGEGLPPCRKKCLLCTRYYTNYLYILARTDTNFNLRNTPVALQTFTNTVGRSETEDLADATEPLRNASLVSSPDGYKPEAMLFVDEEFIASSRLAREGPLAVLPWRPVVRFCSSHYRYVRGRSGPLLCQVGIGVDTSTPLFSQPPPGELCLAAAITTAAHSTHRCVSPVRTGTRPA